MLDHGKFSAAADGSMAMRIAGSLLGALLLVWPGLLPAQAEKRVALVIGNSAYRNVSRLDNPGNDATLLAGTLRDLGFTLIGGGAQLDLDKSALDRAVQAFGAQLSGADVGLFYFAGHGIQVRSQNYLVPVDANPTREVDVDFQMLDVNLVLRQMEAAHTRLNILVLDACRNNPFSGRGLAVGRAQDAGNIRVRDASSGLAQMRAPEGTLISFATQPGSVALDGANGNSPYARALADTIRQPGLNIFDAFNQVGLQVARATGGAQQPWVSNSPIDGSFYFVAPAPVAAADPCAAAETHWKSAEAMGTQVAFEDHLARFPTCVFAGLAKARIEALKQTSLALMTPPFVPPNLGPPAASASSFQEELVARMAAASVAPDEREARARSYRSDAGHKAIAVSFEGHHTLRTANWATAAAAEISALEGCQLQFGQPCALVAADDRVAPAVSGEAVRQDMPRLRYSGEFLPEQIPRVRPATQRRSDVINYRSAAEPKAAALHPGGVLVVVTGAVTPLEAQEKALAQCNNDPDPNRTTVGGPCYLYAAGDQVVLPQRLMVPVAVHEELVARFAAAAIGSEERERRARDYEASTEHKAVAISFEGHRTFRTGAWPTASEAEVSALEGCQLRFGSPCVLGAVDGRVAPARDEPAMRRDMARLRYAGEFVPEQIPRIRPATRQRSDVVDYRSVGGPKAAAIHPEGIFVVVTDAVGQAEAEEQALAACNSDPDPGRSATGGPCYLYASGNEVVLSQRLTKPVPRQ